MKKTLLLLGLIAAAFTLPAQGIEFFHGTWQEALAEAKKQDKILFVDGFTVWCGPCKRMSSNVFPNEKVGEFYNKNFINLKVDMESGDMEFRRKYPATAYPTLYYIDYTGEMVHQVKGAMDVDGFIKLGETALSKIDRSKNFEEAYNAGNRDPELVYQYVQALNKVGKPTLAISNEYIRTQKDLTTPQNLRFILEAAVECDSRIFDLLLEHRAAIERVESEVTVLNRIELACSNTVKKAMDFQSPDLLEEAKAKMTANHPDKQYAEFFCLKADRGYAKSNNDVAAYLEASGDYAKKVYKIRPQELSTLARETEELFSDSPVAMKEAEKWAGMAAKDSEDYTFHLHYARLLWTNGNTKEARKAAERALELAQKGPKGAAEMVQEFIENISGKS
ncbi:MAG: thioredoxin family protein [Saprospirales bacterium]|nr:thioredoxin family protein [Saprospirales bacterium]